MYYLSEVLSASKQNYPHYQKMCYGVHFASKKLKPYFQDHPITVVCTAPLGEKALPLYQLLKKTTHFEWNDKEDEAFL